MHSSVSAGPSRGTPSRRGKSPKFAASTSGNASTSLHDESNDRPTPSFFSCLSIPVEGSRPIEPSSPRESSPPLLPEHQPPETPSGRAPRRSKTEALAALNNNRDTPEVEEIVSVAPAPVHHPAPIPVSPSLDFSTIRTISPRDYTAPPNATRPFGLQDCPTFYPTAEEFKDPMAYVRSITPTAQDYGICKVVPPEGWKMPFVTDTETFRFKTRLQRLNSIEATSRAKLNFLEQLYKFHSQQGNSRVSVPTINHKPLDLWLLRKEVQKLGGYDKCCEGKKWSDIGKLLGYTGVPGLSTQIKTSYARVILPYEDFCKRSRNFSPFATPSRDSPAKSVPPQPTPGKLSKENVAAVGGTSDLARPTSPLSSTSSVLSELPDDEDGKNDSIAMPKPTHPPKLLMKSNALPTIPTPIFHDRAVVKSANEHCEICGKMNRGEEMLLCDGCDCGFHMFCLDPPLDTIPKDQWFCYKCLSGTGGDFGFDEGEEHSLSSFQARDTEFRRLWWSAHPPDQQKDAGYATDDPTSTRYGNITVTEYDVEKEFWRLVESPHDTVETEYGADVHSTTHGSGMPTMENHPLSPYSKDPWNLNNLPIVPDSLLRYIKSDISGMTVPWTYVGMAFSTFCWHNEDHYTYSINFMHWGETKTWYGVPGEDSEKFEAAIQSEAPDLFETQPDLLFQLVTLMNPKRLTEAGVRVFACNQRAGEFVITFPKAYHAGLNHGLNFNEAVNFALPDWLDNGRACARRYREHRKLPVFSHDELLITVTQQSQSTRTAMWLLGSLKEMVDREMRDRNRARAVSMPEILDERDRPEEQYQCTICKTFCYLSHVTCPCSNKVVCVDHIELLCELPISHLTFRIRFSDAHLLDTLARVSERAAVPAAWQAKFLKSLEESGRPHIRSLRALVAEGEKINFPIPELATLKKCVAKAGEWIESANVFLVRKPSRKRPRRARGRPSLMDVEEPDRPERGLAELHALLEEVPRLGFDSPEIASLRVLEQQAEELRVRAANLLTKVTDIDGERGAFITECKTLLLESSSVNVLLEELAEIEKIVDREQLIFDLDERLEDEGTLLTLTDVCQLLDRAHTVNLDSDNKHLRFLESKKKDGEEWRKRAEAVLEKPVKTIKDFDDVADTDTSAIPIDPEIMDRITSGSAKARDFEKQALSWLSSIGESESKPRSSDIARLVARAEKEFSIPAIDDLKHVGIEASELETKAESVLKSRYRVAIEEDTQRSPIAVMRSWLLSGKPLRRIVLLPSLDKLEYQLQTHDNWQTQLPWSPEEADGIVNDVLAATRTGSDEPPRDEYITCICEVPVRPPPPGVVSDAVQCDHCNARFHGECANNGGSCPFCDHHHWNGQIAKKRNFHFCYLPNILKDAPDISRHYSQDFKQLEIIVHRVGRLSTTIGQFLEQTSHEDQHRVEYKQRARHFMRKLFRIQFAVSPMPDVSFGLDLAGLHRILAGQPAPPRVKKRKRPRWIFTLDVDPNAPDGTRCVCRGRSPYVMESHPLLECDGCRHLYHPTCVLYVPSKRLLPYTCPLCCVRKGNPYPFAEVRVQPNLTERRPAHVFVDTQAILETGSKEMIYKSLDPPRVPTLFIELLRIGPLHNLNDLYNVPAASPSHGVSMHPPPDNNGSGGFMVWDLGSNPQANGKKRRFDEPLYLDTNNGGSTKRRAVSSQPISPVSARSSATAGPPQTFRPMPGQPTASRTGYNNFRPSPPMQALSPRHGEPVRNGDSPPMQSLLDEQASMPSGPHGTIRRH